MTKDYNLTIAYDITESGIYEHDVLANQLAGEEAVTTSFGSVMHRRRSRMISYKYPTQEFLDEAIQKFLEFKIFRIIG
jgi:hypothetical protein